MADPTDSTDASSTPQALHEDDELAAMASKGKVTSASTWIFVLAILFAVFGTLFGFLQKGDYDAAMANLAQFADDDIIETADGATHVAGELRRQVEIEFFGVFVLNYVLTIVFLGLFFWSKKSPLPAIITALCVYLAVMVLNAIVDPSTIAQGIIIKILFIGAMVAGLKAALRERLLAGRPSAP